MLPLSIGEIMYHYTRLEGSTYIIKGTESKPLTDKQDATLLHQIFYGCKGEALQELLDDFWNE